jgi:hypothetical protein
VAVRLRGTGKQILQLRYLKPAVTIDLSDVGPGTFQRTLGPADVPLEGTTGVTVLSVRSPEVLSLEIGPGPSRVRWSRRSAANRSAVSHRRSAGAPFAGAPDRSGGWLAGQESLLTLPIRSRAARDARGDAGDRLLPPFAVHPGSVLVAVPIEPGVAPSGADRGPRRARSCAPSPSRPQAPSPARPRSPCALDADAFRASVDAAGRGRGDGSSLEWSGRDSATASWPAHPRHAALGRGAVRRRISRSADQRSIELGEERFRVAAGFRAPHVTLPQVRRRAVTFDRDPRVELDLGHPQPLVAAAVDGAGHPAAGSSLAMTRPTGVIGDATGMPTSKSNVSGCMRRWCENAGPVAASFCAERAAITSATAGRVTLRISARGDGQADDGGGLGGGFSDLRRFEQVKTLLSGAERHRAPKIASRARCGPVLTP